MKPKHLYLALCLAGIVVPYAAFVPWLVEHGLDVQLFARQILANRISVFFALDVIVSAVVVIAFVNIERRRADVRHLWAIFCALLLVGVSLALPLFLYLRETALDEIQERALASATR